MEILPVPLALLLMLILRWTLATLYSFLFYSLLVVELASSQLN